MVTTNDYPKTMRRGVFKGQTFNTQAEYAAALAGAKENGTVKPRQTRKTSGAANGVTRAMAASLVQYANIVLAVVPYTRDDVLDEVEAEALTLGILETARSNKYFANLIVKTCQLQSGSRLAFAAGAIVARRVARREILPVEMRLPVELGATMMLTVLAQDNPIPAVEAVSETVVETADANGHGNVDVPPIDVTDPFAVAR